MQFRLFFPPSILAVGRTSFPSATAAALSLAVFAGATTATATAPADSKSAAVAKELSQALSAGKLDGMAAADPSAPGTFVAAIFVPGAQLLVVSARYAAPPLLLDKINSRDYRGLYMDLHSAGIPGSRVFVQDQGADGLIWRPEADQGIDTWEENDKAMAFNGAWKRSKMSEADYTKAFIAADERYAKLLSLLLAQANLKRSSD